MRGSQHNDPFVVKTDADGKRRLGTSTNHSGGVQGGITNGEPIVFRVRAPCASARRMLLRAFPWHCRRGGDPPDHRRRVLSAPFFRARSMTRQQQQQQQQITNNHDCRWPLSRRPRSALRSRRVNTAASRQRWRRAGGTTRASSRVRSPSSRPWRPWSLPTRRCCNSRAIPLWWARRRSPPP